MSKLLQNVVFQTVLHRLSTTAASWPLAELCRQPSAAAIGLQLRLSAASSRAQKTIRFWMVCVYTHGQSHLCPPKCSRRSGVHAEWKSS